MLPSEARELKQLREEKARLKRVVADLTLDKVPCRTLFKKALKPVKQSKVVQYWMGRYQVSERRATRQRASVCRAFTIRATVTG
jgi:hypothetical protein